MKHETKEILLYSFAGGLMGAGATLLLWAIVITIVEYIK